MLHAVLLLGAIQQAAPAQAPVQAAPAAIARVELSPAEAAVQAGDTVRLAATAYDAAGRVVPGARLRWFQAGGHFEGAVDSTGLVTAGSAGSFTIAGIASVPGGGRPATAFARITVLPGPAARVAVEPEVTRMYAGQSRSVAAAVYSALGEQRYDPVRWSSDEPGVVSVGAAGRLTAHRPGRATVTAAAGNARASFSVAVAADPVTEVAVEPAEASVRTGDVLRLGFVARDAAGRPVEDAAAEWSLAPGSGLVDADGAFVADLPGTYRVVARYGSRTAEALVQVRPRDAARPATVVGRLPITLHAAEFWLHPDGKHGYLTTVGDRIYAVNLADPAKPAITDSVVVDARTVNDLMTTEDGRFGVMTREGASTRRNGIVILSFEDPAHPRQIAEYTETVSGGVHSTFVYRGHVYLTDDATGSMRVIDIQDPYNPREVARWQTETRAGRMLHDIDVQDGLAYLSYWNDGLIVLDVGNGIKGGSPSSPQLVSQLRYDLQGLYRDVEAVGGPGFIRGTHTAWRSGRYVFVGDEVFSAKPAMQQSVLGLGRAYGRLHVVDVADIANPRIVAWYEPKDGGAHNVWVAGDTLYMGTYQGGLRVLDISGELRGDLLRQGREIAHVHTGDRKGFVPNAANTWGAIYRDGLVYVPDMNSGLWIVRVEGKSELVP